MSNIFRRCITRRTGLYFGLPSGMDAVRNTLVRPLTINFRTTGRNNTRTNRATIIVNTNYVNLISVVTLGTRNISHICIMSVVRGHLSGTLRLNTSNIVGDHRGSTIRAVLSLASNLNYSLIVRATNARVAAHRTVRVTRGNTGVILINCSGSNRVPLPVDLTLSGRLAFGAIFHCHRVCPVTVSTITSNGVGLGNVIAGVFSFSSVRGTVSGDVSSGTGVIGTIIGVTRRAGM